MAKLLSPTDLGLYGLTAASIGYALYLLGFDFYTYTTRELLKNDRRYWGAILKNQTALSLVLYAFFLPALSLIFVTGLLPWHLAKWFFLLIILEHICQEISRLLVAISEQLFASTLLFVRQGSWAIAVTVLMIFDTNSRNLDVIFKAWIIAGTFAVILGIFRLYKLQIGGWANSIDWSWILKGIKISAQLLIATIALRGIFTLDRFWLQSLTNLEVVGAYVLFMSLASAMMTFLDAGVFSYSYPTLIKAYQAKNPNLFRSQMREMLLHSIIVLIVFSLLSLVLLPFLLTWIANPVYFTNQNLYPWMLVATILNGLSMIPHYALYAQRHDRPIVQSHFIGFVIFILSTLLISMYYPSMAVPAGLCVALFFILAWKTQAYFKHTPALYRGIRIQTTIDLQ